MFITNKVNEIKNSIELIEKFIKLKIKKILKSQKLAKLRKKLLKKEKLPNFKPKKSKLSY